MPTGEGEEAAQSQSKAWHLRSRIAKHSSRVAPTSTSMIQARETRNAVTLRSYNMGAHVRCQCRLNHFASTAVQSLGSQHEHMHTHPSKLNFLPGRCRGCQRRKLRLGGKQGGRLHLIHSALGPRPCLATGLVPLCLWHSVVLSSGTSARHSRFCANSGAASRLQQKSRA